MIPSNYLSDIYPILNKMTDVALFNINNDSIINTKFPNIVGYQDLYNVLVDYQNSQKYRTDMYIIKSMISNCVVFYCGHKYLSNIESEIFDKI